MHGSEGSQEGTAVNSGGPDLTPGGHGKNHRNGEPVEQDQPKQNRAHGRGYRSFGELGLTCRDRYHLYTHVARNHKRERKPNTSPAVPHKTTTRGQVRESDRRQ